MQEMIKKGIFISQSVTFISYSHTEEDVEKTLSSLDEVCKKINEKVENENYEKYLDGNAPTVVWKMIIPPTKKI